MTSGYSSSPSPFINKGIAQKHDPSQLGPGEYYFMENAASQQEGALTIRTGHRKLSQTALSSPIVSLSKLNLGGADTANPRYRGSGSNIYRDLGLTPGVNTSVYSGLTSGARWSAQQYNAGASGAPSLYLATQDAALRDGYAPGSTPGALYSTLQKWGIDPPPVPVQATPNIPFVSSLGAFDSGGVPRFVEFGSGGVPNASSSSTTPPGNKQIASLAIGVAPQLANVVLTGVVFSGGNNTFTYTPGLFTPATSEYVTIIGSTTAANDGTFQITGTGVNTFTVVNASGVTESDTGTAYLFQGAQYIPPGYVTFTPNPSTSTATVGGDGVNGIYVGMLLTVTDAADGNETVVVLAVDTLNFYAVTSKSHWAYNCTISGSQISGVTTSYAFTGLTIDASFNGTAANEYETDDNFHIALQTTNTAAVTNIEVQVVPNSSAGSPTDYYYYDIIPSASMTSSAILTNPAWVEFNIPKSSFLKSGNAGAGVWTWQNITQVIVVVTGGGGGNTVNIGNIYFIGGGGLNSIAAGTTPYDWMMVYRNPTTQQCGNPSPLMATPNLPPPINNGQATLTLTGTAQAATVANGIGDISGPGSIKVYRRGGTFSDGFYRHIGYAANPGTSSGTVNVFGFAVIWVSGSLFNTSWQNAVITINGNAYQIGTVNSPTTLLLETSTGLPIIGATYSVNSVTFVDNSSDQSLDQADTLQFDNDPPVPSNLTTTLTASIYGFVPQGGGTYSATSAGALYNSATHNSDVMTNGIVRIVLYDTSLPNYWLETGSGGQGNITNINFIITVGSTIQVGFGDTFEQAIVTAVGYDGGNSWGWVECWLQYNHYQSFSSSTIRYDASDTIEIDSVLRGKCNLAHQDFDCVFLAGDPNNPATLYQSKVGRPESFPVLNLENNFIQQVTVGSPSNPINGITSIGPGELVCLNLDNIFIVQVWAGQMQQPIQAPATRGLFSKWCWCKGDNRIWYLGYDGIYTWAGGQSQKISEQIDFMFKKQTVNGIDPIDMTQALAFSFCYAENSLYFSYIDTGGKYHRLRYESLYNRWELETIYQGSPFFQQVPIDCLFLEPDTGNFLVTITDDLHRSWMWLCDFYSTTDGWSAFPNDGYAISYSFQRYWPIGDFGTDYQIGEFVVEMANSYSGDSVGFNIFYNYGTVQIESHTVLGGAFPTRGRYVSTVNNGVPVPAYSIGINVFGSSGKGTAPVFFYTFEPRALKLEQVTAGATLDWDDLGYPYDKLLQDVTVQYDTGGQSITVALDTVNGITGNTENTAVATYTLSGNQRSQQVFPVPADTIAKLIRLRPINASLSQFKWWKYNFNKVNYPPDTVLSTDWSNSGYGCDKTFKWLKIQVDTGGVATVVEFQVDGAVAHTFVVNTTTSTRDVIITLPSNITGKQWRLVIIPTTTGKFQLFGIEPQFEKLPCGITHFDSLMQVFGSAGWKIIWQCWVDYQCVVPIIVNIHRDDNVLFYQKILGPQAQRDVQRFYLPPVFSPAGGVGPVFNKSQSYQILIDSSDGVTPFYLYRDGTRVEIRNLSAEQRGSFDEKIVWTLIPLES